MFALGNVLLCCLSLEDQREILANPTTTVIVAIARGMVGTRPSRRVDDVPAVEPAGGSASQPWFSHSKTDE